MPREFTMVRGLVFRFRSTVQLLRTVRRARRRIGFEPRTVSLTPQGFRCWNPPTTEVATASLAESVSQLLGTTNPCAIPEKEVRREQKRCKHSMNLSGARVGDAGPVRCRDAITSHGHPRQRHVRCGSEYSRTHRVDGWPCFRNSIPPPALAFWKSLHSGLQTRHPARRQSRTMRPFEDSPPENLIQSFRTRRTSFRRSTKPRAKSCHNPRSAWFRACQLSLRARRSI